MIRSPTGKLCDSDPVVLLQHLAKEGNKMILSKLHIVMPLQETAKNLRNEKNVCLTVVLSQKHRNKLTQVVYFSEKLDNRDTPLPKSGSRR